MVRNGGGDVTVEGDSRSFLSLDELVEYFQCNRGRLVTRLRRALSQASLPVRALLTKYIDMSYEVDRADVSFSNKTLSCPPTDVGSCHRLYVGTYRHSTNVRYQSSPIHTADADATQLSS